MSNNPFEFYQGPAMDKSSGETWPPEAYAHIVKALDVLGWRGSPWTANSIIGGLVAKIELIDKALKESVPA